MGTQANVLTPQQMRCIYALARGGGISNDDLHAVVFTTTGKDSISSMLQKTNFENKLQLAVAAIEARLTANFPED